MAMHSVDSIESGKSLKQEFKDSLCHLCFHGAVVSSLSLMQEVVGSIFTLFIKIFYKF